jgi:hypothetical protein
MGLFEGSRVVRYLESSSVSGSLFRLSQMPCWWCDNAANDVARSNVNWKCSRSCQSMLPQSDIKNHGMMQIDLFIHLFTVSHSIGRRILECLNSLCRKLVVALSQCPSDVHSHLGCGY